MLQDEIDPITYTDRLTMPILVISATGDEFFAPDDSYEYFDKLVVGWISHSPQKRDRLIDFYII